MSVVRVVQAPIFISPISGYSGRLYGTIEGHDPETWRDVTLYKEDPAQTSQGPRALTVFRSTRTKNGTWEFRHREEEGVFTIIAWDHTNMFDPVIKVGLIPEPM